MSCPLKEEHLVQLKGFIDLLKTQPQLLNDPKLLFFRDYIESLGGSIPVPKFRPADFTGQGDNAKSNIKVEPDQGSEEEVSEPESDVELDMEGVIDGDELDSSQEMGDESKEITEEEQDQSDEKRSQAMKAFSEQNFEEAIKLYTEAIKLNPTSALLFAKRGQVYLKLNKPNACIKDCTRALELNCDSATAYKFRGRAYRLLGKWEEAAQDLREAVKIDFEEQANEWLAEVTPNANKLHQHRLNVQRKREEKEHREKVRRLRKVQEARAKAAQDAAKGAGAGAGGGASARSAAEFDFMKLLSDPELVAALEDPEVSAALQDVTMNPANIIKYQSNPKVAKVIEKFMTKMSGAGAGASGGMPGFGSFPGGTPEGPFNFGGDDVGLD